MNIAQMSQKVQILFTLLLFASPYIWAQSDYKSGYIITNQNDTIFGWIDYRGAIRNAKICSFKKLKTDMATDYSPLDILAYRFVDNKLYISKNIDNAGTPKHVFLECLFNGQANLYYYRDDNRFDHYYVENDEQFFSLEMIEQEVMINGVRKWKIEKPYVGALKAFFNTSELYEKIDGIILDHKSLIGIFKEYHHYLNAGEGDYIIFEKKEPLKALRFGPMVGVEWSIPALIYYNDEKHRPTSSTNISVGANVNVWIPRVNEKLFLQLQASYTKYYFFDAYETPYRTIDLHIKSSVLHTGLAFKYEYPRGRWRPTLAIGATAIYLPNGTIKESAYRFALEVEVRPVTEEINYPTKLMAGFSVIPGVHYYLAKERIIYLQVQFQQYYAVVNPPNMINSFGLSAGIYFTKR